MTSSHDLVLWVAHQATAGGLLGPGRAGLSPGRLSPSKSLDQISSHGGSNVLRGQAPVYKWFFKLLLLSYVLTPPSPKEVARPSPEARQEGLHRGTDTRRHDSLSAFTTMITPDGNLLTREQDVSRERVGIKIGKVDCCYTLGGLKLHGTECTLNLPDRTRALTVLTARPHCVEPG